jgi:hypothetical protein
MASPSLREPFWQPEHGSDPWTFGEGIGYGERIQVAATQRKKDTEAQRP